MITVTGFKHAAGESVIKLCFQCGKQLVDGEDGIIDTVTGVNSRDLLISDQQKRLCRIQLKAGVQNIGKNIASQFGKCSSSDFSPIQKALVGCLSNGIKFTVYSNGKPEVFSRIIYGFLCDTCSEITEATVKRGCFVQRLDLQGVNLTSLPLTRFYLLLVVVQHILIGAKCAVVAVLTLF